MTVGTANWFQPITKGEEIAVFGFPFSGSGAAMFGKWRKDFLPEATLLAGLLPGRENRLQENPYEDLNELAEVFATAIAESTYVNLPICLVGFSMGGVLAFEVARRLRSKAVPVRLLIAGSARAPHKSWTKGNLHRLKDDAFIKKMNGLYEAIPEAVINNEELRNLLLPTLRADIKMLETYKHEPQEPLDCEILTLHGTEDIAVLPKHISPWREVGKSYRHRSFAGGHFFIREHQVAVLKVINGRIRRLLQPS